MAASWGLWCPIEDHAIAIAHHLGRGAPDALFLCQVIEEAHRHSYHARGQGNGAAVDPLQQPLLLEAQQVAPDDTSDTQKRRLRSATLTSRSLTSSSPICARRSSAVAFMGLLASLGL